MDRTCQKCGLPLQENDFLCPQCGAIYGEPTNNAPKVEEQSTAPAQKRSVGRYFLIGGIMLLIVLACLFLWDPYQPTATTPSTSQQPTPQPTTSTVPTQPPTVPTTVPTATLPSNEKQLNWTMDAKVVHSDGRLITNTTVTINGHITKQAEAADILLLDIVFLPTFHYMAYGPEEYPVSLEPGKIGPYYIISSYFYDRTESTPVHLTFALDPEAECAIFLLPGEPGQYLVCSTAADVNAEEIIAHFQAFLDSVNPK